MWAPRLVIWWSSVTAMEGLATLVHDQAPIREFVRAVGVWIAGLDGSNVIWADHGGSCAAVDEELYFFPFLNLLLNPIEGVHGDLRQGTHLHRWCRRPIVKSQNINDGFCLA